ncbi:hypothetical protein FEM48_Zijuj11G0131800 [Ziziphus jujuba var. spinosa]|uniref:pyridoxal 5'-phosphate synthase n=1 Tax=Ziziphus jujuba var. spinosa TaxID=714518 RepID=A0A978UJ46_ZIZJJ|nr:pyridoxine/pyridoxamine 5'-phosphate oxidase 2-like [Ziziphus jujuba var. spinosa]KAH7514827.1 hypothetical protein FEM48_Zijuj11G0131800 [Ziziphus jujuba var. spinosa]
MGTVTAPWKQLVLEAMESNAHLKNASLFQLATVGLNGRPSNRTVLFRGFQDGSDRIEIDADSRSHKIEELKHCPFAEICWYFADSLEQFRIKGTIEIIDESSPDPVNLQQREKSWFARSPRTKMLFLDSGHSYLEPPPKDAFPELCGGPVAAYCILVLHPEQVDYMNGKSNQRQVFTLDQNANGDKCWT